MKKALVMLSGGIDSAVALAVAINKFGKNNVLSITFDYNQTNKKEIEYSKKLSQYYGIDNELINIKDIFLYSNSSILSHSNKKISHKTYEEQLENNKEKIIDTNVPFRNGLFLSVAVSYALSKKIDVVVYGIHYEVGVMHDIYPDCSPEFNKYMNKAIYYGSGKKVSILAPLVNITKTEVVKKGIKLNVPFKLTWTCYENGKIPCGKCNSCQDRKKAFLENDYIDPFTCNDF